MNFTSDPTLQNKLNYKTCLWNAFYKYPAVLSKQSFISLPVCDLQKEGKQKKSVMDVKFPFNDMLTRERNYTVRTSIRIVTDSTTQYGNYSVHRVTRSVPDGTV